MILLSSISLGCRSGRPATAFAQPALTNHRLPQRSNQNVSVKTDVATATGVSAKKTNNNVGLVSHQSLDNAPDAKLIESADVPAELIDKITVSNEVDESNATDAKDNSAVANQIDDTAATADSSEPMVASSEATGITLATVLQSVADCHPKISIGISEIEAASGKTLASWGEFDTVASAHSISQPLGFYQTYRNGAGISRPLYSGGEIYGTYRIGDGNFEPWYGERETNEGGEFKAGFDLPLLKDRHIDKRRVGVQTAQLQQQQLSANVETRLLDIERAATQAYWDWLASGQSVTIQRQLLNLAETRVDQIDKRMAAGDLAAIAGVDNNRFIAKRKNSLIKAKRGLEKAAIKLSLFYRDASCQPIVASAQDLPARFPIESNLSEQRILNDSKTALANRPELVELAAARQEAQVKLIYAENLLLPKLDIKGFAGQDVGGETSSLGDKTPFQFQFGVFAEVPLERRKGSGKIVEAQAKIAKIDAKHQLVSDKIRAAIQDAASAVKNAAAQIQQSRENVRLTDQSLRLGRLAFEAGDIDLLALNIYESSIADAKLQLLEAQYKYFSSLTKYETTVRNQAFINTVSSLK